MRYLISRNICTACLWVRCPTGCACVGGLWGVGQIGKKLRRRRERGAPFVSTQTSKYNKSTDRPCDKTETHNSATHLHCVLGGGWRDKRRRRRSAARFNRPSNK